VTGPKTIAVLSDIHANYHALTATLAAIDSEGCDELWCLGDLVGYGPQPNECCALVKERATVCLSGNHDLAALGAIDVESFNDDAAAAVLWTRRALDEDAREFLRSLEPSLRLPDVELFHGSPLDPVWDYVLSRETAIASFAATAAPLVLVGHSHVPLAVSLRDDQLEGGFVSVGAEVPLDGARWLLNPGSVGQPRGNDPAAGWLLLDSAQRQATFRRTSYPVERTQAEMRERGLPEALAARLEHGV
jgi:predicted phosphodiesterase